MKVNYCLPIIKKNKEEILKIVRDNSDYSYFEVWLDYIENFNTGFVKELIEQLEEKLILVFRRKNLNQTQLNKVRKNEILNLLNNSSVLVDLDIFDQKEELGFIKNNNLQIKTIVSYHNYDETPSSDELVSIVRIIEQYNPYIYKIATMCKNENDSIRLLELLLELKKKQVKCIVLGMGSLGIIIRIFGTLWGNEMIFAPQSLDEKSAEGQFTKEEYEKIFKILN